MTLLSTLGRYRHILGAAIAAVAALAIVGFAKSTAKPAPSAPPPPEVTTVAVEAKNAPVNYEFVGQTEGSRAVEVRARVTGILVKRNYTEGSRVSAGQSLFSIDPAPFKAALARAEADLAGAEARHDKAQRDAARLKPLYEAKAVSQKDYDDAFAAEQIAAADVKSAQTRLTDARLNLDYTRVEAPIGGIVSRSLKSEGSLVSGPDVLLTTVTQTDPIYVNFGIADDAQLKLKREVSAGRLQLPPDGKFAVAVLLADGSVYARPGTLGFTDVRVNTTTASSDARATLPNPDGVLQPGQFVRVRLGGAVRQGAIAVPQRAVLEGPKGKFVYVVNAEGKAEARPVEVGDWAENSWFINSGLKAGERVIVDGVMKIGPGAPVRIAAAEAAPPAGKQAAQSAAN